MRRPLSLIAIALTLSSFTVQSTGGASLGAIGASMPARVLLPPSSVRAVSAAPAVNPKVEPPAEWGYYVLAAWEIATMPDSSGEFAGKPARRPVTLAAVGEIKQSDELPPAPVMRAHKVDALFAVSRRPSETEVALPIAVRPVVRSPAIYYPPPVRESGSLPRARNPVVWRRVPIMVAQYSGPSIANGSDPLANLMFLQSQRRDPRRMRGVTRTVVPWFIMVPDR